MKKMISVLLTLIMLFTLAVPAFALYGEGIVDVHESRSQVPVIRILGDGEPLYDAEGNKLFSIRSGLDGDLSVGEGDGSNIYESIANVLLPFLIDGLLNDEWDAYYENLQKEISELSGDSRLDGNGNPVEGTGLSQTRLDYLESVVNIDKKEGKGYYGIDDYRFWYDWRLDPLETADKLHEYIQKIKSVTKCDKVSIMASCIGTIVTTSYIAKYGVKDIQGVGFTGSIANGAEVLSEVISGKFDTNGSSINRVLMDSAYLGIFEVDPFINTTIELLTVSGVLDGIEQGIRDTLYDKLVAGVTSALALSTFYTYPSYWAAVSADDYDDAINYVFGEEGSEKRTEYAGLIAKLENYDTVVRQNFDAIIRSIRAGGANFAAIAKYGFQILPICESYDAVSDQFVSVKRASFGATTSTIYDTLSDEYIAKQQAAGLGEYISPDKQIDASTCIYPDSTWFVKNSSHSEYTVYERKLLYDVITADEQLTTEDFPWSQFMVFDYAQNSMEAMTEENCNTEQWEADKQADTFADKFARLFSFLTTILNWFTQLFGKIFK